MRISNFNSIGGFVKSNSTKTNQKALDRKQRELKKFDSRDKARAGKNFLKEFSMTSC
jgi:hypothetical protein